LVLAILAFLISYFDRKSEDNNHLNYGVLLRSKRKILIPWLALIVAMVGLYIFFNGH